MRQRPSHPEGRANKKLLSMAALPRMRLWKPFILLGMFFLFVTNFIAQLGVRAAKTTASDSDIGALISKKMVVNSVSGLSREQCSNIFLENIEKAIDLFPHNSRAILDALADPDVKLICRDKKSMSQRFPGQEIEDGYASFNALTGELSFLNFAFPPSLANHEFLHIDRWRRHRTKRCDEANPALAMAPVYPFNGNSAQLAAALDAGDRRILEFKALRLKARGVVKLSLHEANKLRLYTKASRDCIISIITSPISEDIYKAWKKDKGFKFTTTAGDVLDILSVTEQGGRFIAKLKPTDPAYMVTIIPEKIESVFGKNANNPRYKSYPPQQKLIERETNTIEGLSELAIRIFYPELKKLENQDKRNCPSFPVLR